MTARIKAVVLAAATLVVGGVATITAALITARNAVSPAMTCAEWDAFVDNGDFADAKKRVFYVGMVGTVNPPAAFHAANGTDYPLGDCAAGTCTIGPGPCKSAISWTYQLGTVVNTRRLIRVVMPPRLALAWKKWAGETANVFWLGSIRDAFGACTAAGVPSADCVTMVNEVSPCWLRAGGQLCRFGKLFGPGQGGTSTCVPVATDIPIECNTFAGAGGAEADSNTGYTDADLQ